MCEFLLKDIMLIVFRADFKKCYYVNKAFSSTFKNGSYFLSVLNVLWSLIKNGCNKFKRIVASLLDVHASGMPLVVYRTLIN